MTRQKPLMVTIWHFLLNGSKFAIARFEMKFKKKN